MRINDPSAAVGATRGSNQSGMRAHNERIVLTLIRQKGPLAKAEIARMTGLSAQTVSVIMRALEADGLLGKGEPVRGKVGQPSVPMHLMAEGAFFFGLKVGRRSLDLILADFLGRVRSRARLTHRFPTPDGVVRFASVAVGQLLDQLTPTERGRVSGLGIAIPFRLWDWAAALGVSQAEMDEWRQRDIAAEIAAICEFPVYLRNDASAACGAELVFGDNDNLQDFLYFFIGFFVGGGLVLGGSLYTGRTGNAAALGSMPVQRKSGELCQLIDVASLAELEKALVDQGFNGAEIWENPVSWELPSGVLDPWLDEAAAGLAHAILSSSNLIDFECAMIDGWMPEAIRSDLVCRVSASLAGMKHSGIDLPAIREGTIGSDARALGAASLPLSERFLVDRNALLII